MKILRTIHIITGLCGALFILIQAITGLLLNNKWIIGFDTPSAASAQKFIQGLHTGTISSPSGWIVNLIGLALLVLVTTGVTQWIVIAVRKRRNNKNRKLIEKQK